MQRCSKEGEEATHPGETRRRRPARCKGVEAIASRLHVNSSVPRWQLHLAAAAACQPVLATSPLGGEEAGSSTMHDGAAARCGHDQATGRKWELRRRRDVAMM